MRRLLPSALSRGSFRSASALRSGICGTVTNVDAAPKITFDRMHHSFCGCSGSHGVVKVMKDVARPTQPMPRRVFCRQSPLSERAPAGNAKSM